MSQKKERPAAVLERSKDRAEKNETAANVSASVISKGYKAFESAVSVMLCERRKSVWCEAKR